MLWSFTQYTRHTESPQQRPSATAVGRPSWPAARNPRPSRLLRTQGFVIQRQPDRQPPPAETAVFVARSHWHPVCSITGYGVEPTDGLRRNHLPTVVGSSTGERLAPARRAGPTEKGTLRGLSLILAVITTAVGGLVVAAYQWDPGNLWQLLLMLASLPIQVLTAGVLLMGLLGRPRPRG